MVLTLGDEREYAGNRGYADELESVYHYDSFVPNHKRVAEGDLLILRNKSEVLGTARVSKLSSRKDQKELRRCPDCGSATIKARKYKTPEYKCKLGHKFGKPKVELMECVRFAAFFQGTFRPLSTRLSVKQVRVACPNYNGQLAMQKLDLEHLPEEAKLVVRGAAEQSMATEDPILLVADASDDSYVPDDRDERKFVERQIRERRGQKAFRSELQKRFANTCPVTRCQLVDLLEAAHINPYRGEKDNVPLNGVLLRADIHTLFDLDLIGIDPDSLEVSIHPKLFGTEYERFNGKRLECEPKLLSKKALGSRWRKFQLRLLHVV